MSQQRSSSAFMRNERVPAGFSGTLLVQPSSPVSPKVGQVAAWILLHGIAQRFHWGRPVTAHKLVSHSIVAGERNAYRFEVPVSSVVDVRP